MSTATTSNAAASTSTTTMPPIARFILGLAFMAVAALPCAGAVLGNTQMVIAGIFGIASFIPPTIVSRYMQKRQGANA